MIKITKKFYLSNSTKLSGIAFARLIQIDIPHGLALGRHRSRTKLTPSKVNNKRIPFQKYQILGPISIDTVIILKKHVVNKLRIVFQHIDHGVLVGDTGRVLVHSFAHLVFACLAVVVSERGDHAEEFARPIVVAQQKHARVEAVVTVDELTNAPLVAPHHHVHLFVSLERHVERHVVDERVHVDPHDPLVTHTRAVGLIAQDLGEYGDFVVVARQSRVGLTSIEHDIVAFELSITLFVEQTCFNHLFADFQRTCFRRHRKYNQNPSFVATGFRFILRWFIVPITEQHQIENRTCKNMGQLSLHKTRHINRCRCCCFQLLTCFIFF